MKLAMILLAIVAIGGLLGAAWTVWMPPLPGSGQFYELKDKYNKGKKEERED